MSFNEQNELVRCQAQRCNDATNLETKETWVCRLFDYRDWHGLRVPTQGGAAWVIEGEEKQYAQFVLRDIEYDKPYAY